MNITDSTAISRMDLEAASINMLFRGVGPRGEVLRNLMEASEIMGKIREDCPLELPPG